jgi:hypothetical protein
VQRHPELRVYATPTRMRTLRCMDLYPTTADEVKEEGGNEEAKQQRLTFKSVFTTEQSLARIHIVPLSSISLQTVLAYVQGINTQRRKRGMPVIHRVIGFNCTGWCKAPRATSRRTGAISVTIHSVPYSEHSSYLELRDFVRYLAARGCVQIVPTVNTSSYAKVQAQIKLFEDLLKTT